MPKAKSASNDSVSEVVRKRPARRGSRSAKSKAKRDELSRYFYPGGWAFELDEEEEDGADAAVDPRLDAADGAVDGTVTGLGGESSGRRTETSASAADGNTSHQYGARSSGSSSSSGAGKASSSKSVLWVGQQVPARDIQRQ